MLRPPSRLPGEITDQNLKDLRGGHPFVYDVMRKQTFMHILSCNDASTATESTIDCI
jgi:hypothetical protein